MRLFGRELHGIPKALVVLVAILLVSSGLCGITTSIEQHKHWNLWAPGLPNTALGNALTVVDLASYAAFMLSAGGIVVLLLVWPIIAVSNRLYGRSGRADDRLQKLLDNQDEKDDSHAP